MAMGVPIICNYGVGDSSEIVEKTKSGWVVKEFNITEYTEIINKIDKELSTKNKSKIILHSKLLFDLQVGVQTYENIYKKI